ncbi:dUTP diphosphatase [Quadrisphaera sp. KR29]|uniref:dUTP diphosphatase n=1 Tax=Quadrisphaera sp. KR29 TaxID=3461391 RepID=UPI0040446950
MQRLTEDLPDPSYAHPGDAGADLRSAVDAVIAPGGRATLPTGVAVAVPEGWAAFVHPRSGLAARHGVTTLNGPGTVDAGYRGEVRVTLINTDPEQAFHVRRGDRIAQLVLQRVARARFLPVASLDPTARGAAGHGSTGGWGATTAAPATDGPTTTGVPTATDVPTTTTTTTTGEPQ